MAMMRFDPFRELESMREAMEETFWPVIRRPLELETTGFLPIDMWETDNDVVVRTAVPGCKPEDINISATDDLLSIRGESKEEKEIKRENYYRREMRVGRFHREVALPMPVQADKAEATFENGMLTLRLPKTERAKAKRIAIKGHEQAAGKQIQGKAQATQH